MLRHVAAVWYDDDASLSRAKRDCCRIECLAHRGTLCWLCFVGYLHDIMCTSMPEVVPLFTAKKPSLWRKYLQQYIAYECYVSHAQALHGRQPHRYQERPYHVDRTTSRSLCEVKRRRAKLALRRGTTREALVLFLFFFFNCCPPGWYFQHTQENIRIHRSSTTTHGFFPYSEYRPYLP